MSTCNHPFTATSAQSEGSLPPILEEEEETTDEMEKEAVCNGCGRLQDELKNFEQKRMELSQHNMALEIKLKASREEKARAHQKLAVLGERLLLGMESQVRRMASLRH